MTYHTQGRRTLRKTRALPESLKWTSRSGDIMYRYLIVKLIMEPLAMDLAKWPSNYNQLLEHNGSFPSVPHIVRNREVAWSLDN